MIGGEIPAYDPGIGQAVMDVVTAWDARMWQDMRRGRQIVALRGAGSVNGIDPAAADNVVELLEPQVNQDVVFIFDGDPDDPAKPDIGYVAGRLLDLGATVVAAQTDDWYYPATPGANLTNAHGEPYETFVIPRGVYPGDHNRLTQSERLAAYPGYSQTFVGAAGLIASAQMVDYCRKVPEGGPVNISVIKAANNGSLSEEIGRKLAQAVDEADRQKLQDKLDQRSKTFGALWDNDGKFNAHILGEVQREEDTHELAVLWDVDSRVEKVDILNCRKIDLSSPEADQAFAEARYYVKTRPVMGRQIPEGTSERVEVKSGATGDTAKAGDWVCRKQKRDGSYGEEYVVHAKDFIELYDSTPDSDSIFVPKWDPRKLVQVSTDVIFIAPWGEKQAVRRGGYLMERTKEDGTVERYGISQMDAETDFEPVS
jgi:hypothetical protein